MTWQLYETSSDGVPRQVLLEDRFRGEFPLRGLGTLAWFGVWCQRPPQGGYWHEDEAPALDWIEDDLIGLLERFGHGWAVYVQRLAQPGLREYFVYLGEGADLPRVEPALTALHPTYRIELAVTSDPEWEQYAAWLASLPAR